MRRIYFLLLILLFAQCKTTSNYNFSNSWTSLGPNEKPLEDKRQSATGIGPIEFVHASSKTEGLLIAGSVNGGLFYSENGGGQWVNAGSDAWHYSTCGWAEFYPEDDQVWFALSPEGNDNGNPGIIGHYGGILRSTDKGYNWEQIGDKTDFTGSEYLIIHGFRFHPHEPKTLFAFTSDGLFKTTNCLASNVKWERVEAIKGKVYDIAFTDKNIYLSTLLAGKWNVIVSPIDNINDSYKIPYIKEQHDEILSITFENYLDKMLILTNYTKKGDELYVYTENEKLTELKLRNQRVIFGWGRTIAVSPHNPQELMLGYSTTMKRWNLENNKNEFKMKGGYHVDLEYIEYDPFDSTKVYIATHGGVYTSTDHCQSWESTSVGLAVAEVEATAVSNIDPNVILIGCYHDGSSMRADWNNNGIYKWKNINGGDGLIPLIPRDSISTVYTSNQYTGGGIYVSRDTGKTNINIHNYKRNNTSGWQMAANLHPVQQDMLFYNYAVRSGVGKGNVEIARTRTPDQKDSSIRITNFLLTHNIERYSVYGIYNSPQYPDEMYIHLIEFTKDKEGRPLNVHRVFRTADCTAAGADVIKSWYEVEIPRSDWIASITPSKTSSDELYLAYVAGKHGVEFTDEDFGMIYRLKYKTGTGQLITEKDITNNLPYSLTGRYNILLDDQGGMFFGTRLGFYYGNSNTLKGRGSWVEVGFGLPHCKIHSIYFNKKENSLTIGVYGRGVWKYYL